MTEIEIDKSEWPLLKVRFPDEPVTDGSWRRYLGELSTIGHGGRPYAILSDLRDMPAPLTAAQRLMFDEWMRRNAGQLRRVAVGNAIVATSSVARGAAETAYWNWRDPPTYRLFGRIGEARGWCRARLDRLAPRARKRRVPTTPPPARVALTSGLIDLFAEPAFLVTPDGAVVFANRAANRLFPPPRPWLADAVSRGADHSHMPVRMAAVTVEGRELFLVIVAPGASFADLPPRLREIARLISCGRSDREIADATGLAPTSVRTYVRRLYARAGVSSRAELVRAWFLHPPDGD